jgi:tetratricopeptide (TPR) repeat protein
MRLDQVPAAISVALQSLQRGDMAAAETQAAQILRLYPQEPTSLMIAGLAAHARGKPETALEFLTRADAAAPGNPMILGNLGVVLRALNRLDEARVVYERALAADPRHFPTRANFARLLDQMGKLPEAEAQYRQILDVKRDHIDALAGLASVLEQRHRLDDADGAARRALAAGPNALAQLTLAKIAVRRKSPEETLKLIQELRAQALTAVNSALADGLQAQAFDMLCRYDEAFAAFARANATLRSYYAEAFGQRPLWLRRELLSELSSYFFDGPPKSFFENSPVGLRDGHAFLVGFPRSGTTLMEQALAAHPDVQSLEEADNFAETLTALAEAPSAAAFLESLTPERSAALRAAYWARVTANFGGVPSARVFLDKMPIHSAFIGVIAKLFPNARIIFALRDPRDAMLSCFQQRFGMNAVMYQFLTLHGTCELYDGVMDAASTALRGLGDRIAQHTIRYERLIADFEGETREIVAFLGLAWSPDVLKFRDKSRERYVSTPSAPQILEPITTAASGKFRNYAGHLAPIMPIAEAWAKKFDYPL